MKKTLIIILSLVLLSGTVLADVTAPVTSGLVMQLDAQTLNLTDGAVVSSWRTSDNSTDFTQGTALSQPTYKASVDSLGGMSAVLFDYDYLQATGTFGISGNQARTVFTVWADATNNGQNYQHTLHFGNNATLQGYGISVNNGAGNTNTVSNHYWGSGFNAGVKATSAGNVASMTYDGTNDVATVNGFVAGSIQKGNLDTKAGGVTLIGSRLNPTEGGKGSTEGISGYVAEVLIYDRNLTTAEYRQVNSYLAQKYSLNAEPYTPITTDWSAAQVKIDFSTTPDTWGALVTENCGILEEGGNKFFRVINNAGSLNNQGYNNQSYSATGSISGKFDLRFTNATADGASFMLAGNSVDVTQRITSSNGETPSQAGSFGIGYSIYNKNRVGIFWDGKEVGAFDVTPSYNLKNGEWFTTEFKIDYRTGALGADVTVLLTSDATGGAIGQWTGTISDMNAFDSKLVLRGRTGGSTANADFDNIYLNYADTNWATCTWVEGNSGDFSNVANWVEGTVPTDGSFIKITGGTNDITATTFPVLKNASLLVSGGTTTVSGALNIDSTSNVKIETGSLSVGQLQLGSGTSAAETVVLNLNSGSLTARQEATIGDGVGKGNLLHNGGTFRALKGLTIQSGSSATLKGGAVISSNEGYAIDTDSVLLGAGSAETTNKLVVEQGATFTTPANLRMGVDSGDYGELVVKGAASVQGQYIFLGNHGNAKVTVDGGTLNAQNVIMGEKGTGNQVTALEILNGGVAKFSGYLDAGDKPTAKGTVTLAGTGSQLRVGGNYFDVGGDEGNNTSVGTFTQTGASLLTAKALLLHEKTSNSSLINISKDSYAVVSNGAYGMAFDDAFRASHDAGTLYVGISATDVGRFAVYRGSVTIPGLVATAGSTVVLNAKGNYNFVTLDSGTTAAPTTLNAQMTIDTNLAAAGQGGTIVIGDTSNSTANKLTIGPNAVVTTNQSIRLGHQANSYGEMLVQGSFTQSVDYLLIGFMGEGKVVVDGGTLTAKNTILGDNAGGNCVGTFEIKNSSTVTLDRLAIGDKVPATGTVTVTDSTLTVGGETIIGNLGVGSLTLSGDSTTTLNGNLRIGNHGKGTLTLDGNAILNTSKEFMLGNETDSHDCSLTVKGNAVINATGNHFILGRNSTATATLAENATINFNGTGVCGVGENAQNVVFNMTGGTFNVNKVPTSNSAYVVMKSSQQNQSGGVMNVGNATIAVDMKITDSAAYNLSGGTLNITGSLAEGADKLHVSGDGILSVAKIAGDFTLEGGTLSPGANFDASSFVIGSTEITGDFTLKSGATLLLEMDVTNGKSDFFKVTGNTRFEQGSQVVLDYDPTQLTAGASFDLFEINDLGYESLLGALSDTDKYLWNITDVNGIVNFAVDANAIPEPCTWVLLTLGLFGVFALRRRRGPCCLK